MTRGSQLRALIIKREPLQKILDGKKTWEIRGRSTEIRGLIGLVESGTGTVVGVARIVGVEGPLSAKDLRSNAAKAGGVFSQLPYEKTYAWILEGVSEIERPIAYQHPSGAVIWVRLSKAVSDKVLRATSDMR